MGKKEIYEEEKKRILKGNERVKRLIKSLH